MTIWDGFLHFHGRGVLALEGRVYCATAVLLSCIDRGKEKQPTRWIKMKQSVGARCSRILDDISE